MSHSLKVPIAQSPIEFVEAVRSCKQAWEKWSQKDFAVRQEKVSLFFDFFEQRIDQLAELHARSNAIPIRYVKEFVVPQLRRQLSFYRSASAGENDLSVGLCAMAIGSADFLSDFFSPFVSALFRGNTVVVHVESSCVPILNELESGLRPFLDDKLVAFVTGDSLLELLLRHPATDSIFVTGPNQKANSTHYPVGKKVRLNLFSQNSAIVLADADIALAAQQISEMSVLGQGRLRQNVSRIFVVNKVFKEFSDAFKQELEQLPAGLAEEASVALTDPLESQQEACLDVMARVERQEHKLFWKSSAEGLHVQPRVIEDLSFCSEFQQADLQCPLALLYEVKYPHEAISWSNTNPYPYQCQLYTNDEERARKLAGKLRFSRVVLNGGFAIEPEFRELLGESGRGAFGEVADWEFFRHRLLFV